MDAKAIQYLPAAKGGVAAAQTIASNSVLTTTIAVCFQFKGNGIVEVGLPFGQQLITSASASAGLSLGEAWLQGAIGATGYAQGVHPTLVYKINNPGAAVTTGACDLIVEQG